MKRSPAKIEIKLLKANGLKWNALEAPAQAAPTTNTGTQHSQLVLSDRQAVKPPSIYRKDFDKIVANMEEDKLEGDAALNKVFQDIFSNGSDEQKKAMVKSFTESGGTVLSTNWNDVGSRQVPSLLLSPFNFFSPFSSFLFPQQESISP